MIELYFPLIFADLNCTLITGILFCGNLRFKICVHLRGKMFELFFLIMTENEISYIVRGCIFKVFNNLGPGLLESAYEAALLYEIEKSGLNVKSQVALPMIYETVRVDIGYRLDLLVEGKVIIELKSVEMLLDVHHKQLITYLKLSGLKLGLLVNFNTDDVSKSIFRKVNGL
jgi:GxxExxY protein